jgi:hypothetical protein
MDIFIIILVVIAAGAAFLYFMGSSIGMKLIHRQSASTIRFIVYAKQGAEPHTPLPQIYLSIAEERNRKLPFTTHYDYVQLLRDHGCFDPVTHPQPEQFAELCAKIEDKIKLDASGVNG